MLARKSTAVAIATALTLGLSCGTEADFVGLSVELIDSTGGLQTYRLFADFDDPTDELFGVGAVPEEGIVEFNSTEPLFNLSTFDGLSAEDFPAGTFSDERDSWVTIGDDLGFPNPTDYSPEFAGVPDAIRAIEGTFWFDDNGGWFNGNPGTHVVGTHLLIAQFTFPEGASFSLDCVVGWARERQPPGEVNYNTFFIEVDPPGACCLPDGSCVMAMELGGGDCAGVYQGDGTSCDTVMCPQPPGACCFDDGSCTSVTEEDCIAAGGAFQGDDIDCAGACPQPGACCLPDGSCVPSTVVGGGDCAGVYQGDGTSCDTTKCPQPTGACCFTDGSCDSPLSQDDCDAAGGLYQGDGTGCDTVDCALPNGACCFADGSCTEVTADECRDAGGAYQGDDTACGGICPQPGACCLPDGSCVQAAEVGGADCVGAYQGDDTSCDTAVCPQPSGACCFIDGSCATLTAEDCTGAGGMYQGDDTTCGSCPQPGACCLPDGSCVQGAEVGGADCDGSYQGDDTDCGTIECPQPTGACCLDDGTCEDTTQDDCAGLYRGDGSTCDMTECPEPGACCFDDGSCADLTETACEEQGGVFQGTDVACGNVFCAQPGCPADLNLDGDVGFFDLVFMLGSWGECDGACLGDIDGDGMIGFFDLTYLLAEWGACTTGACCFDDGRCEDATLEQCEAAGGIYQGDETDCDDVECPEPVAGGVKSGS
ncbi:MAG: hypothetical protein HKO59_07945 [Phycisphaerales bacterium]|nr:hypothetical protein [Phycisphaerales bacterium]